ncbi:MAG: helix-turn-helix transcriptional regulator [Pseudomonadota bacterium]
MSQEQLGGALGLTFQQVQKYEKGLNRIGAGRLFHIAEILGVEIGFFYEGLQRREQRRSNGAANGRGGNGHAPRSSAPSPEEDGLITRFLASSEGYTLSRAFCQIENPHTRSHLLELVRTIAEGESDGAHGPRG